MSGTTREFHGHDRIDDVAVARLEFAAGGVAALTSVWHDILERPSLRHVEVFCERLHIALDGDQGGGAVAVHRFPSGVSAPPAELVAECLTWAGYRTSPRPTS